jgi:adenylate kinase
MIIVFLGAPGAGKGTIGDYLIKNYQYVSISTGNLIRQEIKNNTLIGQQVKQLISDGKLVGDEIVNKLVDNFVSNNKSVTNLIFDGYPRTVAQAAHLSTLINVDVALHFQIDREILLKRITGRYSCPKCNAGYNIYSQTLMPDQKDGKYYCKKCQSELIQRSDDNEKTFKTRYQQFLDATNALVPYYQKLDKLVEFDANTKNVTEFIDLALQALKIK